MVTALMSKSPSEANRIPYTWRSTTVDNLNGIFRFACDETSRRKGSNGNTQNQLKNMIIMVEKATKACISCLLLTEQRLLCNSTVTSWSRLVMHHIPSDRNKSIVTLKRIIFTGSRTHLNKLPC
jgi:ABC-type uncharacterized transport system ATPase subunit